MPISSPLITVPTTRPRSWSAASDDAIGTITCATVDVTPTTPSAAPKTTNPGAAAATPSPIAVIASVSVIRRAPLAQVTDRDQQREPDHVPELADGHQQPRGRDRDVEIAGERVQQRLRVVEVRDRGAAGEREQQDQAATDTGWVGGVRAHRLNIVAGATFPARACYP